ncbi:MAG: YCF48-related protein [Lentimicrobium sp.]
MKKNSIITLLTISAFLITSPSGMAQDWARQNPYITEQTLFGVFMTDINHAFIAGGNGEMYFTLNGGETWVPNAILSGDPISSVFFSTPLIGYYCYYNNIGRSTDGGNTWTEEQIPVLGDLKKVWFLNETHGWACGAYKSLFRTTDAGNTWEKMFNSTGVTRDFNHVEFVDADTGFVAGTYGFDTRGLLYRSFDGGVSLEEISIPEEITGLNAMDVLSSQELWIGASQSFYSPDGPVVKVYHTTDQGLNWDTISFGPHESSTGVEAIQFLTSTDGKIMTSKALYSTSDGGATWVKTAFPGMMAWMFNMHFADPMTGIITGLNGDLLKTSDGGLTFEILSKGSRASLRCITFIDENTGFAAGSYYSKSKLLKTVDKGQNWTEIELPDSLILAFNDIESDGNSIYIASNQGLLLKSDDLGASFSLVQPPDCAPLKQICIPESQHIIAVGYRDIYFSDNDGSTWEQKSIADSAYYIQTAKFITNDIAYISMRSVDYSPSTGYLLYTEDAGDTWQTLNYGETNYIDAMDFYDPLHGTIAINAEGVSYTSDGGATWSSAQKINNLVPEFVQYFEDSTVLIAEETWLLAKATHGDTDWDIFLDHQEGYWQVNAYYFSSPGIGWLAGNGGLIMIYNNPTLNTNSLPFADQGKLIIFPNPATDVISILPEWEAVCAEIIDLQGRLIQRIILEGETTIHVGSLIPGYYTLNLISVKGNRSALFLKK